MTESFAIGETRIGGGAPCLIIGEVAQAHDGSLGTAHAFIDAIADAGADAVKFQTHIAEAESTPGEPWRVRFSTQDASRYEYWKRMEFTEAQWQGLKQHADERGLLFLSSPFSVQAAELLSRVGVPAWKVASGELTNRPLIEHLIGTELPVFVSTGMSELEEVDGVVAEIAAGGVPYSVMQCTTAYPCPPEKIGLNLLPLLRERYRCPVGLSDHSGEIYSGIAAAVYGASVLEVHVTFHRGMFGPDVPASLTPEQLLQLVDGVRFVERMMGSPVDKQAMAREMAPLRALFTKSIVAAHDLPSGTVLERRHLATKKPGAGTPAERLPEFIGRTLIAAVMKDEMIVDSQLEQREK